MTLYNELIKVSIKQNKFQEAINYQSIILSHSKRKEFPLVRRAELYLSAGNYSSASADLEKSLNSINLLPERIRINKSIRELQQKIESLTTKLGKLNKS